MSILAERIPEPEHMTIEEELSYAKADYSIPHENLAKEIVAAVGRNHAHALDIGCGPGDVLLRIRQLAPNWTLYGADISTQMLSIAVADEELRSGASTRRINWTLTSGREFGFADDSFDVVISNSVLHHVAAPALFWTEIRRTARDGAHVFVRDLRRPADRQSAQVIMERNVGKESHIVKQHYLSSLLSSYTPQEVEHHLDVAGIRGLIVKDLEDRYLSVEGVLDKSS